MFVCMCELVWWAFRSLERHQMKMTRISTSGRAAAFLLFNMRRNPHGLGVKTGMNNWCGVVPQSTFFQLIGFKESEGWNIIIQPGVHWNGRWGRIIAPPSRLINPGCQLVRCSIWCFKGRWHVIFRDKLSTVMTLSRWPLLHSAASNLLERMTNALFFPIWVTRLLLRPLRAIDFKIGKTTKLSDVMPGN